MTYASLLHGRHSLTGQCYSITTATADRQAFLANADAARIVMQCARTLDVAGYSRTLAMVVMPDHVHWLFRLGMWLSLSEVVRRFKGRAARELGTGTIWQHGFHDHGIRTEESLAQVARYIIENPIRAGLAERIEEYPFWYSAWEVRNRWDLFG